MQHTMSLQVTIEVLLQVEYTVFRDIAGAYVAEDHPDATPVRCDPPYAASPKKHDGIAQALLHSPAQLRLAK